MDIESMNPTVTDILLMTKNVVRRIAIFNTNTYNNPIVILAFVLK
jgi:hypothetical protein